MYKGEILTVQFWFLSYIDWRYTKGMAIEHAQKALANFKALSERHTVPSDNLKEYINGGLTAFGAALTAARMLD